MPAGREADAEVFYAGVLGIPRVLKPANLERRGGCWFRSAVVEIHMGVEEPFSPARKAHPALLVDDLETMRARLTAAGAAIVDDEPLPRFRRLYTTDPFGNRIELLQDLGSSPGSLLDAQR